jgi:hypothetical protein
MVEAKAHEERSARDAGRWQLEELAACLTSFYAQFPEKVFAGRKFMDDLSSI